MPACLQGPLSTLHFALARPEHREELSGHSSDEGNKIFERSEAVAASRVPRESGRPVTDRAARDTLLRSGPRGVPSRVPRGPSPARLAAHSVFARSHCAALLPSCTTPRAWTTAAQGGATIAATPRHRHESGSSSNGTAAWLARAVHFPRTA